MNLYLISQDDNEGWGTYDSAVVVAATEEAARKMNPGLDRDGDAYATGSWAVPDKVLVRFLGVADDSLPSGSVCASYNAG